MTDGRQRSQDPHGMRTHGRRIPCALALGLGAIAAAAEMTPPPQPPAEIQATPAATRPEPAAAAAVARRADAAALGMALDDARLMLAAGRAREAANRLADALAGAGPDADRGQHDAAVAMLAEARVAEGASDVASAEAARRTAASDAIARADQEKGSATSLRSERLARIADLRSRGLLELALATCRSLLRDLPADEEVDTLFRAILAEAHQARNTAITQREQELRSELAVRIEQSLIPEGFDGMPMFPTDWDSRRSGRKSLFDVHERAPAWMEQISDRLAERTTIQFDATPLADAISLVARLGGMNIVAAPELLAATDKVVTMRAAGMRLENVLTWICDQAGTKWSIANGGIFIGEQTVTERQTAIHDIGELLVGMGDAPGPEIAFNGGGSVDGALTFTTTQTTTAVPTADDVADLIRRSVSPRSWDDAANAIIVRGNALFITAPDSVQRLVREFLRAQSAQHSLSVRVELRWLELTDGYLEQIGVQWTGGTGTQIDLGSGSTSGLLRTTNGWAIDGATTNVMPSTSVAISPATAGTGLTLQSAHLGSTGLSAVLHAVERNQQGRLLQAPELTCLNGQRAHAFFGRQIAYISDYEVVNSEYDALIDVVNTGTVIDVRPLVSADRKYVTLELRSTIASATLFTDYITTANPDETDGVDTDGDGIVDIFYGVPLVYPIELPNVYVRSVGTAVMMPDRGSMLVGGFGHSIDEFSATRVPMLGSIPFLGRLFGARGRYAQRSNLYLLTTSTIINYPELEARL